MGVWSAAVWWLHQHRAPQGRRCRGRGHAASGGPRPTAATPRAPHSSPPPPRLALALFSVPRKCRWGRGGLSPEGLQCGAVECAPPRLAPPRHRPASAGIGPPFIVLDSYYSSLSLAVHLALLARCGAGLAVAWASSCECVSVRASPASPRRGLALWRGAVQGLFILPASGPSMAPVRAANACLARVPAALVRGNLDILMN